MGKKILIKDNKILKIGNTIMGIQEDYPFWQVNADTSDSFYDAFDENRLAAPVNIGLTNLVTGPAITSQVYANPVLAPDGINVYFPPLGAGNIMKYNSVTNTATYISQPSGANKCTGGVLRGKFIYFIPRDYAHIIKLDTTNDTFTLIGNYAGTNKWGRPILASNGLIIAPGRSATTWLVIDKNDNVSLVNMIRTSVVYSCCEEGPNGEVYAFNETTNQSLIDRININTLVTSTVNGFNSLDTSHGVLASVRYRNLVFLFFGGYYPPFILYNMSTNQFSSFASAPNWSRATSFFGAVLLGPDGYIYYIPQQAEGGANFWVFNPITLQRFDYQISSSNFTRTWDNGIFNKNGRLVFTRFVNVQGLDTGIPLKENRYLSRIVNK